MPMNRNSTLFFFYDNTTLENELLTVGDIFAPYDVFKDELGKLFADLEFSPGDDLIKKILAMAL